MSKSVTFYVLETRMSIPNAPWTYHSSYVSEDNARKVFERFSTSPFQLIKRTDEVLDVRE